MITDITARVVGIPYFEGVGAQGGKIPDQQFFAQPVQRQRGGNCGRVAGNDFSGAVWKRQFTEFVVKIARFVARGRFQADEGIGRQAEAEPLKFD